MVEAAAARRVLVRDDGGSPVRTITLARPERHNALVPDLLDELLAALHHARDTPQTRCVVLAAEGPSFSTGGDVGEFAARSGEDRAAYARRVVGRLNDVLVAMLELPAPIVAAVHGPVTGGSVGLVLASDIVLVGSTAWLAPYYVDVGFSPDGGWTTLLPDRIGAARAASVQLTNQRIDAETAVAWGLASHVVNGAELWDESRRTALRIAGKPAGSVRRTKRLLAGDLTEVARRLDAELASFVEQITTDEATRGMTAFLRRHSRE